MTTETRLAEPCTSVNGHHVCLTHNEGFPHNMAAKTHEDAHKGCAFAWACVEHGLERAS